LSPQKLPRRIALRNQSKSAVKHISTSSTFRGRDKQRVGQLERGDRFDRLGRMLKGLLITELVARDELSIEVGLSNSPLNVNYGR